MPKRTDIISQALATFILTMLLLSSCTDDTKLRDTVHPAEEADGSVKNFTITTFTEAQRIKLEKALQIANSAINDSLFEKIIRVQAKADIFPWDHGRLSRVDPRHHADPVPFFLAELRTRGLPNFADFVARDDYHDNDVTGSTLPCSTNINFNVRNLDRPARTATYVAGTIVHERIHSFCFKHRSNDITKQYNLCDFAYHAGHITIIISLFRANNSMPIEKPLTICGSLLKLLQAEKIIK